MAQPAAHLSYYSQPSLGHDGSAFIRDSCARGGRQGQSHRGCSTPTASVSHRGEGVLPALATSGPATRHLLPPELRPSFLPREGPSCFSNTAISCEWTSGNSVTKGTKLALHHALLFVNLQKPILEAGHFRVWKIVAVCTSSCGCPSSEKPLTLLPQPHPPGPHPQGTPPLYLCVYRPPTDPRS